MENSLSLKIANYVHKVNNRLGSIRTYAYLIQVENPDIFHQTPKLEIALNEIETSVEDILSLTDELKRSFVTPDSRYPVSVREMLTLALSDVLILKTITVTLEIGEALPQVYATRHLAEVFRNMVLNACEAMPEGGQLKISVNINADKEKIEIAFSDTGRGIPLYVVESLFLPYFSTKKEKGHGLGLWWSKAYLESIGGSAELLWSEVGKGSSFLISIPFANND